MLRSQKDECSGDSVVRLIAAFEGLKGALVLAVGFALLGYIHADLQSFCEDLVRALHLNPARGVPRIFIASAGRIPDSHMQMLILGAALYAIIRFIEAFGLWHKRAWAELFALVSCAVYLPIEVYEISRGITSLRVILLLANSLVVGSLWLELQRRLALRKG